MNSSGDDDRRGGCPVIVSPLGGGETRVRGSNRPLGGLHTTPGQKLNSREKHSSDAAERETTTRARLERSISGLLWSFDGERVRVT
jgi:hypothetical protein